MNYVNHLNVFFRILRQDNSLSPHHISLYLSLFQYWNYNRFQNPYPIKREDLMKLSKIGSRDTYHKCLKDLHNGGYIFYQQGKLNFERAKISMVRLDKKMEKHGSAQLDIFSGSGDLSHPGNETLEPNISKNQRPKNGSVSVPLLTKDGPENGRPDSGLTNKLINKTVNSVCNTPTKIFIKNDFLNEEIGQTIQDAPPPKMVSRENENPPALEEVRSFFLGNDYPVSEAHKFFLYNEARSWMLTPKLRILNWQSLAHKWMLSAREILSRQNYNSQNKLNNDKDYGEPL